MHVQEPIARLGDESPTNRLSRSCYAGAHISIRASVVPTATTTHPHDVFGRIVDCVADRGWSVTPDFLPRPATAALLEEEKRLWKLGAFKAAAIGRGPEQVLKPEIRSDRIAWLDPAELTPATDAYCDVLKVLRDRLNGELYLGLRSFEGHFAAYPPGSFYKRHLDQHRNTPHRIVSCILYLNEGWLPSDGGHLRIYENERCFDIAPEAGTFVCFRSDLIEHEVLPTNRTRFSITGWLRREAV